MRSEAGGKISDQEGTNQEAGSFKSEGIAGPPIGNARKGVQGGIGLKIGKNKVNFIPKKTSVDKLEATSSKGSRFKILEDRLEEDIVALENKIREISKIAGALLDITNGEGSNKYKKESAKGKLKMAYNQEGSATLDRDFNIVGTVGLCYDIIGIAVVVISSADSKFEEVAFILKEAMVEDLA
ncbi:hypothetical protein ACOSQ2_027444 [Xanthoceras sorbifolium]